MKQDKAIPSIGVRYVPYGINGEYFIYDNNDNCIPIGHGHIKGTKKFIQGKCDELNRLPSIGVKDEFPGMPKWDNVQYRSWRQWAEACYKAGQLQNMAAMEELYKALEAVYSDIEINNVKGGSDELNIMVQTALNNAKTIKK